jgi:hypothetical protein
MQSNLRGKGGMGRRPEHTNGNNEGIGIMIKTKQTPWPEPVSKLYWLSVWHLSAKLVATFADRGCHIVSVTYPYSRISRPEPLLFLPSSSSVVLTRLSGPRSTSTTSQKIW